MSVGGIKCSGGWGWVRGEGGGGGGGGVGGMHGVNVAVDWNRWLVLKYALLLSAEIKANSPKHLN